jgi:hypothetical protein
VGAANSPFIADDLGDGCAHGSPAQPSCSQQLRAHLVDLPSTHTLLAPGDAKVVDTHEPSQFDGQDPARSRRESGPALEPATAPADLNEPHRNEPHKRRHNVMARAVVAALPKFHG